MKRTIVTLCGSTRFTHAYQQAMLEETLAGKIVLTIGAVTTSDAELLKDGRITVQMKRELDALHLDKIRMSDEVLILNVGGYMGESTRNERDEAVALGLHIRYLENHGERCFCAACSK